MIVGLSLPSRSRIQTDEQLDELEGLVEAAGGAVVSRITQERGAPVPATWIGKGKVEEIARICGDLDATLVVFDDDLSPAQAKNLSAALPVKVIDRSVLILDIFASRARTREAKTQVELAQMEYMLPRLTRQWSHLSRQAGGIGTRGVGETQLEIDRRLVRNRIKRLEEDLEKIDRSRKTQRASRDAFSVALVGYTNAGKSTLFNRLTGESAYAADKLFATLDARVRRIHSELSGEAVIIDTVGFVRKLPHHLVASFRSTMEEAVEADLVLHVVDASHPLAAEQEAVGNEVLRDLGVDSDRVITVLNKSDRLGTGASAAEKRISVSALSGEGIDLLLQSIRRKQEERGEIVEILVPHTESREMSLIHEAGRILEIRDTDQGRFFRVWIPGDKMHLWEAFRVDAGVGPEK